ncbi:unnamed protein product [Vitrella brassicaformis CCMP3155]|uniref:Amino acid transporter n=1 Tax=Vitrella brassicaformis (strain CCMP3155) TaxID=1169540 RepID=A0A0G4FJ02_VITBC|nr:unnamed protein product [Vitrella brassicaformis CCMP3155]|eukprot:CEM13693.1 unnamed protein product [Vitrella brassicaformis CCMP3155]
MAEESSKMALTDETQTTKGKLGVLAFWRWPLHWQALGGIVMGLVLGYLSGGVGYATFKSTRWDMIIYDLIGDMFLQGLKMVVVPLVLTAIVNATAGMGDRAGFGRLGGKTVLFYLVTSLCSTLIGLAFVNIIKPGEGSVGTTVDETLKSVENEGSDEQGNLQKIEERSEGRGGIESILTVFRNMVPPNIFAAFAEDQMLGVIVFALLFSYYMARLQGEQRRIMTVIWEGAYNVMLGIVFFVLNFLPLGVMCLIAQSFADAFAQDNFVERMTQLGLFAVTSVCALATHIFILMPLFLFALGRVNPIRHFNAVMPALLTAFSTASSSATLPLTMSCVEQRAGVSKRMANFVLPLGATVNMDGSALYECVVVIFLAQFSGIELTFTNQLIVVILALLTSIGVAGIPSASLVAIVVILNAVNANLPGGQTIPLETLAVILIIDRPLDMCRTAVNVMGDTVGTILIARSEGEKPLTKHPDEMQKLFMENFAMHEMEHGAGKGGGEGGADQQGPSSQVQTKESSEVQSTEEENNTNGDSGEDAKALAVC